jgi:hypothetical protein
VHAFGTLSQILGVRLRSWRGIFSYSSIYKLDIVGMDKCWKGCTSLAHHTAPWLLLCPHNHEPYDYRMQHDFCYEYIWGN